MSSSAVGLLCLFLFALSQGARDALFGNVFQSVSFFFVAALAFGASTLCFSSFALFRRPADFRTLRASPAMFAALNATTAIAWLSYFFALKHLESAVVATLYNGIGPLTVIVLAATGWVKEKQRISGGEAVCHAGIVGALLALACVVLTGRSGLALSDVVTQGAALISVVLAGVTIAVSHMIARRFNDRGVGADTVMGTRFLLTLAIAAGVEAGVGQAATQPSTDALPLLVLTAFALIAIPSFTLQLGIARASPLAVNVMRSLGPVAVFAVQQFDGRLRFSGATLICVAGFCAFAIGASVLRGIGELRSPAGALPLRPA